VTKTAPPAEARCRLSKKMAGEGHKPGSVPRVGYRSRGDDHSSRTAVADGLKQPTRESRAGRPQTLPYLALLRMGFTEHPASPPDLVSSYLTLSPLPAFAKASAGGLLSVALSLGSPPVPVRNHPALRSPDFPPPAYTKASAGGDHPSFSGHSFNYIPESVRRGRIKSVSAWPG
jgi:hypothetical protein